MTQQSSAVPWALDRGHRSGEMGYLTGLDGVRALAVVGVLLYHADLTWIRGGFLGVDVFFVLSGFLITSLILEEIDRSGRVDFKKFYLGRARRLLPALLLVLGAVCVAAAFFYRDAASQVRADTISSLLYVTNWWYIVNDASYFEFIGRPPLLKHLWSLAVEEQFYLIWPAVAYVVVRRWARRGLGVVALVLALLSTGWMIVLSVHNGYPEYADPSRAYFGTDSHAMGLLIGAVLATFWRPGRMSTKVPTGARAVITAVGLAALVTVVCFFCFVGEFTSWLYRGGFLALAVIVALLIAMASHPASPLGPWMGTQPWRYLGQRSYGLYLWHWPIFMLTRPALDIPLDGIPLLALRLALTVGVAELSFRFVEMPIRRGAIGRWISRWRVATGKDRSRATGRAVAAVTGVAAAVIVTGVVLATAPAPSAAAGLAPDVAAAMGIENGGPTEVSIDASPTPGASALPDASASAPARNRNGVMSAIGDSVMLGARGTLVDVIPGARVDAAVSRFPGAFIGRIKKLKAADRLADIVVLHPGTNGVIPEDMMREMLDLLKSTPTVVVVNDAVPRTWNDPNNAVIRRVAKAYPNVTVADWSAAADGHDEYFVSDGVHLTKAGAKAYAKLIKRSAGL